jgi:hypothetical protein
VTISTFGMTALLPDGGRRARVPYGFPLPLFRCVVSL